MKLINSLAIVLIIVGGLNWGLVWAFDFNLVNAILGSVPVLENIVYILVGISALLVIITDSDHILDIKG